MGARCCSVLCYPCGACCRCYSYDPCCPICPCCIKIADVGVQYSKLPPPPPPPPPSSSRPPAIKRSPFTNLGLMLTDDRRKLSAIIKAHECSSFKESLQAFNDDSQITQQKIDALLKSRIPEGYEHLTRDESAAIYFFTMRDNSTNGYFRIRDALKFPFNPTKIEKWAKYLNLLTTALEKIPMTTKENLYQCISYDPIVKRCFTEQFSLTAGFASTSPDVKIPRDDYDEEYGKAKHAERAENKKEGPNSPIPSPSTSVSVNPTATVHFHKVQARRITELSANYKPENPNASIDEYFLCPDENLMISKVEADGKQFTIHINEASYHFACPTSTCRHRCHEKHRSERRCNGCEYEEHNCTHGCSHRLRCFHGGSELFIYFKCRACEGMFCEDCSMKGNDPRQFKCKPQASSTLDQICEVETIE